MPALMMLVVMNSKSSAFVWLFGLRIV